MRIHVKSASAAGVLAAAIVAPHMAQAAAPALTMLYTFAGGTRHGRAPQTGTIMKGGVIYGTSLEGGHRYGTVYSLTPPTSPGGAWTQHLLYAFASPAFAGSGPPMALEVVRSDGTLLGANMGNSANPGMIYLLTPSSTPGSLWTVQTLHKFKGSTDGSWPMSVMRAEGAIYGATLGQNSGAPNGTVFALSQ